MVLIYILCYICKHPTWRQTTTQLHKFVFFLLLVNFYSYVLLSTLEHTGLFSPVQQKQPLVTYLTLNSSGLLSLCVPKCSFLFCTYFFQLLIQGLSGKSYPVLLFQTCLFLTDIIYSVSVKYFTSSFHSAA